MPNPRLFRLIQPEEITSAILDRERLEWTDLRHDVDECRRETHALLTRLREGQAADLERVARSSECLMTTTSALADAEESLKRLVGSGLIFPACKNWG